MEPGALFDPDPMRLPEKRRELADRAIAGRDWRALGETYAWYLSETRGLSENTIRVYQRALEDFLVYVWTYLGRDGLRLDAGDVRAWLEDLRQNGLHVQHDEQPWKRKNKPADATLRAYYHGLREAQGFFDWLGRPLPDHLEWPPPPRKREPETLSEEEYQRLLEAADQVDRAGGLRLSVELMGELGLTGREVVLVLVADVDPAKKTLQVRRNPYQVDRTVPLTDELARKLSDRLTLLQPLGATVFTPVFLSDPLPDVLSLKKISPHTWRWRLKRAAKLAGLSGRHYWRALRNRGILKLYERTGDLGKLLQYLGQTTVPSILA